jgi:hypothetical protein
MKFSRRGLVVGGLEEETMLRHVDGNGTGEAKPIAEGAGFGVPDTSMKPLNEPETERDEEDLAVSVRRG